MSTKKENNSEKENNKNNQEIEKKSNAEKKDKKDKKDKDEFKTVILKKLAATGSNGVINKNKDDEFDDKNNTFINPIKVCKEKMLDIFNDLELLKKVFSEDLKEYEDKLLTEEDIMNILMKCKSKILKNICLTYSEEDMKSVITDNETTKVTILRRLTDHKIKGNKLDENDEKLYKCITKNKECLASYYVESFKNKSSIKRFRKSIESQIDLTVFTEAVNVLINSVDSVEYLRESIKQHPELEFIINKVIDQITIDDESVLALFNPTFMDFNIDKNIDKDQLCNENDIMYMYYMGVIQGGLKRSTINISNPESRQIFIKMGLLVPNEDEIEDMENSIVESIEEDKKDKEEIEELKEDREIIELLLNK